MDFKFKVETIFSPWPISFSMCLQSDAAAVNKARDLTVRIGIGGAAPGTNVGIVVERNGRSIANMIFTDNKTVQVMNEG